MDFKTIIDEHYRRKDAEEAALDKLCIDRDEAMKEWFVANMTQAGNTLTQLW